MDREAAVDTRPTAPTRDADETSALAFGDALRQSVDDGCPGDRLLADWRDLRSALDDDPGRVEAVLVEVAESARLRPVATLVPGFGIASAALSGRSVVDADPAFRDLFGEPGDRSEAWAAVRRLAARVRRGATIHATLRTIGGQSVVAVAASGPTAAAWPLGQRTRAAVARSAANVVVLVYAPAMAAEFAPLVASAYRLTPAETRIAVAALEEATLDGVASAVGVSVATARQHMRALLRKTGAARRADLIVRLTDVVAGEHLRVGDRAALAREAFGLSPAETRVALSAADGATVPAIAVALGVSAHTVRSQLDAVFGKTGARRTSEVARLLADLYVLACFVACGEGQREVRTRLLAATRILAVPGGRRIAMADHGPADGRPVLCFHGSFATRWLSRRLVVALQARGFRPISFDRPGFGLTDPAEAGATGSERFAAAAMDAEYVVDRLALTSVRVFASDGGVGAALAFGARCPGRIEEGVLVTPRSPTPSERDRTGFVATLRRTLAASPATLTAIVELLRRRGRPELLLTLTRGIVGRCGADLDALADPAFRDGLVASAMACAARTPAGVVGEHRTYLDGWAPPAGVGGRRWVVVGTGGDHLFPGTEKDSAWNRLPGLEIRHFGDAGRFARHSHADEIAAAFSA